MSMSSRVFEIAFRLGARVDPSLRNAMNNTTRSLNNMNQRTGILKNSFQNLRQTIVGVAGGMAVFETAKKAFSVLGGSTIKANADMETYLNTLTVVMKSHKKAVKTLAWAKNFANKTPFETDEIVDATAKLQSYGLNARKILPQIGDMSSVMGKSLDQGVEAIADAQTGELERLKEFGVTKDMIIAEAEKLRMGMVVNGKGQIIDQKNFNQALFALMKERYSGGMEMQSKTLKGMLSNIRGSMSTAMQTLSQPLFQKLESGLQKIMPLFDGLTGLVNGDTKVFSASMNKAFGPQIGGMITNFTQKISSGMQQVGKWMGIGKQSIQVLIDYLKGDNIGAINLMTKMGLSTNSIVAIQKGVNGIKSSFENFAGNLKPIIANLDGLISSALSKVMGFWSKNGPNIMLGASKVFGSIGAIVSGVIKVLGTVFNIIKPILKNIGSFIISTIKQVSDFWNQNGTQIMQAVQNVFSGISAVIKFLSPVIIAIINSVWGNVKGVIQGALSVIMGLIKIFAGLFTGDFSKMWEGIKQVFSGAVQFLWNGINLLFVGKILGGIKSLGTGAINVVKGMWSKITGFFTGGAESTIGKVNHLTGLVTSGFNFLKQKAINIVTTMWHKMANIFGDIVGAARALPGKMGSAIKSMAGKAWDGIKSLGNKMLSGIGKVVNGVIKGLNWILPKLGIKLTIDQWKVPQYANGTKGHPGGPAIVGDGGGPELIRTPAGKLAMSPAVSTLVNLPKGSQVLPYKQTKFLMDSGLIPAYASGIGSWIKGTASNLWNGAKNLGTKTWNATKSVANKVKDTALDIWSYIDNPSKLLSKVLEKFGIKAPKIAGVFKNIGSGAFSFLKAKAVGFLKKKMAVFGNWKGGAAAPAQVKKWIMAAINATGVSPAWLGALTTLAMKESGGNPQAVNRWDSNWKAGHPSMGLMQTIQSTFDRWKLPGMHDILNPIHNAAAAIRYMIGRYKSIGNVPGIRNMAQHKGYVGYAKGGKVPNTQWALVGERGPELMKLSGGTQIFSNKKSNSILSNLLTFGQSSNQQQIGNRDEVYQISIDYHPDIIIQGNADENVVQNALQEDEKRLKSLFKQWLKEHEANKKRLGFN